MHMHYLLSIIILMSSYALTMDQQPETSFSPSIPTLPSLQEISIEALATGYGPTYNERKKNAAQIITALQTNHLNGICTIGTDVIEKCKTRHIGLYGWGTATKNQPKILLKKDHELYTDHIIPYDRKQSLYIINNDRRKLSIANIQTGKIEKEIGKHTATICTYAITNDGKLAISATLSDKPISIYNIETNQLVHSLENPSVFYLATANDICASTDYENNLKIWDIESGACQQVYQIGYRSLDESAECLVMNNRSTYVGRQDGYIMSYDIRSPRWDIEKLHKSAISSLMLSQKNPFVFYSGSRDLTIQQWDIRNMKKPSKYMMLCIDDEHKKHGHQMITNIYESKNGENIFATTLHNLCIWNIAHEQVELTAQAFISENVQQNCITMNDDETELYTAMYDNHTNVIRTFCPHPDSCSFDKLAEIPNQK